MSDIAERLRHAAGHLINGTVEDGAVETAMLCESADEIERLRAAEREAFQKYVDANEALIDARAQVEGAWQPIGTAPMDGTPVLVGAPERRAVLVRWTLDDWRYPFTTRRLKSYPPTHWMPLPEPPK